MSRRVACAGQRHIHLRGAEIAEAEDAYRLPAFEEQGQTDQGDQRRDDIRQLRAKEVRAEVLGNSERTACDYHRRPGLFNAAPAVHNRHDPEQHDNGQERQLATHHLADGEAVDTGHLTGYQDRDAHRAEGHRRGVDDQAQACGIQRVKPEADQQRRGNRHRRAKSRRPFEKGAEREADDQHLQALVRRNRQDRRADNVELSGLHRDFIDEDCGNNNPGDGPQPVEEAIHHRGQGAVHRHFIEQQCDGQGDRNGPGSGEIAFQFELYQRKKEKQNR